MQILGVDIGGSGIKGQPVDITTGELVTERIRYSTPKPATPESVAKTLAKVVKHFKWSGPIGCGFPAIIQHGVALSAANVDHTWIGTNVEALFSKATGCPTYVVNDADAAGIAEVKFGSGKGCDGVVMLITIGTGLGSALFTDGSLVSNTELGHLILHNDKAERYASDAVRKREDLSWKKWGSRFNEYLQHLEFLFSPDLFILGGGASKKMEKFKDQLKVRAEVKPAALLNKAGTVGAALFAGERHAVNNS